MVTKIENEDEPILRLHVKFENDWSVQARTLAQNVRARPIFLDQNFFSDQNFFRTKNFSDQKVLLDQNNFRTKHFFGPKICWTKKNFGQNFVSHHKQTNFVEGGQTAYVFGKSNIHVES